MAPYVLKQGEARVFILVFMKPHPSRNVEAKIEDRRPAPVLILVLVPACE
ncbi:hypothetical protein BDA96_03G326400 [Sorghum bicolor]|uniref:Uncharacterized protein n=1 Tax=Sorghum bicolor TaxID=4558 RepID=A0A921RGW0_SORBI|nr:hypothetical protein BDA96_03G326400 [Sorghum bicolor]